MSGDGHLVLQRLRRLADHLRLVVQRDPEQEVQGIAVPVLDAVISQARTLFPEDPVVQAVSDIISVETIAQGDPVRAVDALLVVNQLLAIVEQEYGDPTVA